MFLLVSLPFFDPPKKNMSNKTPQSSKERTSSADLIAVGGPLEFWRKRTNEIRLQEKNTPEVSIKKWMGPSQRTPN